MKIYLPPPRFSRRHFSAERKPDFFIVGAPKCGTSAMAHYLAAHPDICMARKEMHFFGADLRFGPQFYRRDMAAYLAEFGDWEGQARAGEASVWYLLSTRAAAEIKAFNADARIIIMLREPAEMLHSLYCQFRCDGNEHLPTFERALAAETERRAGRCVTRRTYFKQGLIYRDVARLTGQVRRYFEAFGRDRVHVIVYDDFAADAAAVYRETLRFLGVDPDCLGIEFKVINGAKCVRSQAVQAVLADPLVRSTALALRGWLPRRAFAGLQRIEARLHQFNTRKLKRAPLAPEIRARLRRETAPEVERLSELLGRDLTQWTREEPAVAERPALPAVASRTPMPALAPDELDQPALA